MITSALSADHLYSQIFHSGLFDHQFAIFHSSLLLSPSTHLFSRNTLKCFIRTYLLSPPKELPSSNLKLQSLQKFPPFSTTSTPFCPIKWTWIRKWCTLHKLSQRLKYLTTFHSRLSLYIFILSPCLQSTSPHQIE